MKHSKRIMALSMATAMTLGSMSTAVAFEFNGESYQGVQIGEKFYSLEYITSHVSEFADIVGNASLSDIILDLNGKSANLEAYIASETSDDFDTWASDPANQTPADPETFIGADGAEQPVQELITVESVSALNKTTVTVTLPEAPVEEPTVGDFKIEVDGSVVAATAIKKSANETKKYELTIPTLGSNEGSLVVNDIAAAISGSDFGYDFKAPTVESVVGVDKNHVKVVFSEKMNKGDAETPSNYELLNVSDGLKIGNTNNPTAASLLSDGKTVLLTTDGTMITFPNGYIAKVLAGVKDAKGNATTSDIANIFSGNGAASTEAPVALGAIYDPSTTKVIKVTFDKDITLGADVKSKITVGGVTLTLNDLVAVNTDKRVLKITLSSATATAYDAASNKNVVLAAGAITDGTNAIAETTVEVVEAAKLTSATYDEATNKLVLNFSKEVKVANLELDKIELNSLALDATNAKVAETTNSATITIDLSKATNLNAIEAVAKTSRKLEIKSPTSGKNVDVNGNEIAKAVYTSVLTYTDDETAPLFQSASYNATTNNLVLTFSEEVTVTTDTMIEVYEDTTSLFDFSATGVGAPSYENNTVTVTLSGAEETSIKGADSAKLKVKVKKTTSAGTAAIADKAGNKFTKDADTTVSIAYTDQAPFIMTSADQAGVAADQVKLIFDKAIAAEDLVVSKFTIAKDDNDQVTVPITAVDAFNGNKTVVLTMDKTNANYVNGYTYEVTTTAKDLYGNPFDKANSTDISFVLNTGVTANPYVLQSAVYKDANENFKVDAGDTVTLAFDGAVSFSGDVTKDDFALGSKTDLGTNFTVAKGSNPEDVVITLGSNTDIELGDANATINITGTAADKHIVGANGEKVNANGTPIQLIVPDSTAPYITEAIYNDANGDGSISEGDSITITFSEDVVKVNSKDIEAVVGAATGTQDFEVSEALDLNSSAVSVDGKTMAIAIGSGTTSIVPGTSTIDGAQNASSADTSDAITDRWGNALTVNTSGAVKIEKSDKVAPTFSNVRIVKGSGNTGTILESGDKVMFDVDEAINLDSLSGPSAFVFYSGPSPDPYNGNLSLVTTNSENTTVTIEVYTGDGWEGDSISTKSTFNIDVTNPTIFDANGNEIEPAAGFGLSVTKP